MNHPTPRESWLTRAWHALIGFLLMPPPIAWAVLLTWLVLSVLLHCHLITRAITTPAVIFTLIAFTVWLVDVSTRDLRATWRAKRAARRARGA